MNRFKLIGRQLWRNRLFTLLNIVGLAIGISACWVVFSLVHYEFSFDKKHPDKENIFKVSSAFYEGNEEDKFDGVAAALPKYIQQNISGVELTVPVFKQYFENISQPQESPLVFEEQEDIIGTNNDYFKMVPYTWIAGNKQQALTNPHEVILTESRAKQYFPKIQPKDIIGKTLLYDSTAYAVTGVIKDLNFPSSFTAKEFIKVPQKDWDTDNWTNTNSNNQLFIKFANVKAADSMLKQANKKLFEMTDETFSEFNFTAKFNITPLSELHFTPHLQNNSNPKILYGLIGIGTFLLLLASINYINLSTALIPYRAKEIGIRKTLGEPAANITKAFFIETLIIVLFALLLSWPVIQILTSTLGDYFPEHMEQYSDILPLSLFLLALVLFISVASSIYPTFLINKLRIAEVIKMKGLGKLSLGSISFRKVLIVFQFVIAQLFVVGTFIIGMQLRHIMTSDLGFNYQSVINMGLPYKKNQQADVDPYTFKHALDKYPNIQAVSLGHLPMSSDNWGNTVSRNSESGKIIVNIPLKYVDEEYGAVYDLKILAGRAVSLADTSTGLVINAIAVEKLGFKTPEAAVGETITFNVEKRTIVGVVDNFHVKNFHEVMEPLALLSSTTRGQLNRISIRLNGEMETWQSSLAEVEKEWKTYYPDAPFEYEFYDQKIKNYYEQDYKFSQIINLSTGVTIILSCLGLLGLVTITSAQRTKEIGIRKVMGSTVAGIVGLLSKDYIKLVIISVLIASPIAWWAMQEWLADFAYKIELSWWMFIMPAIATILVAFVTMSYQSMKAAKANPVDSLRDE